MAGLTNKQRVFVDTYLQCFNASEAARVAGYANPGQLGYQLLQKTSISEAISQFFTEKAIGRDEVLGRLGDMGRGTIEDVLTIRPQPVRAMVIKPVSEIIPRLEREIEIEQQVADEVGFVDDAEEKKHNKQIKTIQRRLARLRLKLDDDPDAVDETEGPWEIQHVANVDLVGAKRRGKLHLVKNYNAKDGKVELYDAQAALEKIGRHHKLFNDRAAGTEDDPIIYKVYEGFDPTQV